MATINLTTQGGRLKYLINSLNLTCVHFGATINRTKPDISRFVNNKKPLNNKLLHQIKLQYPTINTAWLQHNTGTSGIENEIRLTKEHAYIEKISNLESEILRLKIENEQLRNPK